MVFEDLLETNNSSRVTSWIDYSYSSDQWINYFVFFGYGITKESWGFMIKNMKYFGVMAVASFLVCLPQLMYWKALSGTWVYNSYVGETFNFFEPNLIRGMFSYRNGIFPYAPIFIFSFIGLFFMQNNRVFKNSLLLFLIPFLYITYSWWCWWYGGSYGSRPIIDIYSLMVIPIAIIVNQLSSKKNWYPYAFMGLFLIQGYFFNIKRHYNSIHFDSMTSEVYWNELFNIKPSEDFWKGLKKPDYQKAKNFLNE